MNVYEILPSNNDMFMCIILPTSYYNPLKEIDALIKQLREKYSDSGYVIFDFLLSTGNTKERFAKAFFDNGFSANAFTYVNLESNDPIRRYTSNYLSTKNFYLKYSVLTKAQRNFIENGYYV